jgi:hypothetical protein
MAITASGLYSTSFLHTFDGTASYSMNLALATYKIALFGGAGNPMTVNFNTDCSFAAAPFTTGGNQVTATAGVWPAGGITASTAANGASAVPVVNNTITANYLTYDWTSDLSVPSVSLANMYGALIYADPIAVAPTKPAIVMIYFGAGAPYSTSLGTFGITFDPLGIFRIQLA